MREMLFRAKRLDNHEWIEGIPFKFEEDEDVAKYVILIGNAENTLNPPYNIGFYNSADIFCVEVDPKTICQYVGLTDKNDRKIFEGDIVQTIYDGIQNPNYVVVWDEDDLGFLATDGKKHYETNCEYLGCCDEIVVVGNIFDNPELLKCRMCYKEEQNTEIHNNDTPNKKAILVIDMPISCEECPMTNGADECILQDEDANFLADTWDKLREGCPLRAAPHKRDIKTLKNKEYIRGWNACIDVILKEGD